MHNFLKTLLDPLILVFSLVIIAFIDLIKNRNSRAVKIFLVLSSIILYMASLSPVANMMCYIVERNYLLNGKSNAGQLDVVVVLGGGVSDNKYTGETMLSYYTTSRILYAMQIFRESGAKYLVFMGKGTEKLSEAEVMKIAAERLGVPAASIRIDPNSRNTWEHAEELDKMFQNKDIKIGLVTSAFHMKRSEREFRKYFSNVEPLPSDYLYSSPALSIFTFLPQSGNLYKFSIAFREIIGITWYRIRIVYEDTLP